jgi:hypothetical protein
MQIIKNTRNLKNTVFWYVVVLPLALIACGEKDSPHVQAAYMPEVDCESDTVQADVLKNLASKFLEEGAKGQSSGTLREQLTLKDVVPLVKSPQKDHSKCSAKVAVNYPPDLAQKIGQLFRNEAAYLSFKDTLEDKYGVVAGAGMHAQLMDAVADGPFGNIPFAPDPATISKHKVTIQKNLEALIQEQLDVAISYELTLSKDHNGKPTQQLKWQINKREALDLNVVLLSLTGLL